MTDSMAYDDTRVRTISALAAEAEAFFDPDLWGAQYGDDTQQFRRDMRALLEDNVWGVWRGDPELKNFKERQQAAGVTDRELLVDIYGGNAFGRGSERYTDHERALIEQLAERRSR